MNLVDGSERLHARVRGFARAALDAALLPESFDAIAVDVARHQMVHIDGFRKLVEAGRCPLVDAASIPAVPVDAFRIARVAAHPPEMDVVRFATSGTTGGAQGLHAMRTARTYRELSLAWGVPALAGGRSGPFVVVALAPDPAPDNASSLGFMMRALMETLDGRSLRDASPAAFESDVKERWLAGSAGVDVAGLERAVRLAQGRDEPLLVLATSFALAMLVDAPGDRLAAPAGSGVMTTGGFKGKVRDVAPERLTASVVERLGVAPDRIIGEYGMTELTSQLYEKPGAPGVFFAPPWLRVTPVDPETLLPVPAGDVGLARFVDLGNVDSAVAIVTQDLVRRDGDGVALLGRAAGAPPRGCSLALREMVLGEGAP